LTIVATCIVMATLVGPAFAQSTTPSGTATSSSGAPVTFTWADTSTPDSLNPLVGFLGTDYTMWALNYDLPINWSTQDFTPDFEHSLVTSVDASPDGLTSTYHLRPGVLWSDGQPFSAEDVAWTLNYYLDNNVPNYSSDLSLVDKVTATDPNTFVITSTQPTSFYSGSSVFLYEYILPKHIWSKYQNTYNEARHVSDMETLGVGTGPFIFTKYVKGQYVELDRNPNYWGNAVGLTPQVDRIIYRIYNNEDAEALALTDYRVREAMRMAIDSQTLVDKVLLGYGSPGISPVQPTATTGDWQPGPNDPDLSFSIANANALLDQAGYTMGPDNVRIDPKSGKPLEFRYYTRESDETTIKTAPYVKDWLSQIGIKVDVQTITNDKLSTYQVAGTYDLYDWGWYPNPDPNYILGIFTCAERPPDADTYRNSDSYYCNPAYDKLYKQQQTEIDPTKRADIVHQMQAILWKDSPYAVKWNGALLEAYRSDRWTGFQPQPAGDTGDLLATYGPLSFVSVHPIAGAETAGSSGSKGLSAAVWIGIGVVIVLIVGAFVVGRRRGVSDEDQA
jgi:peptide/nickel transport system substrate-binding protein